MILQLDTSALIDSLTGPRRSLDVLAGLIQDGHRLQVSTIVLFEWWRGPRTRAELAAQEELLPAEAIVPFTAEEAALAARLYRSVARPRGREIDLAIAACALVNRARFWTLNPRDFDDVPGLILV
jgi:predicted nucleic acid-binding protein